MEYWSNGNIRTLLQHSNTPLLPQNELDGVPLCFMLPRFSRPESRS